MGNGLIDLIFIAPNQINIELFKDGDKLLHTYLEEESNNDVGLEGAYIDTEENLGHLMAFLFGPKFNLKELVLENDKKVVDLTQYKHDCISERQLEISYEGWIELTGRDNTMDEYGNLICIIGYINKNIARKYLAVIIEKRNKLA